MIFCSIAADVSLHNFERTWPKCKRNNCFRRRNDEEKKQEAGSGRISHHLRQLVFCCAQWTSVQWNSVTKLLSTCSNIIYTGTTFRYKESGVLHGQHSKEMKTKAFIWKQHIYGKQMTFQETQILYYLKIMMCFT